MYKVHTTDGIEVARFYNKSAAEYLVETRRAINESRMIRQKEQHGPELIILTDK